MDYIFITIVLFNFLGFFLFRFGMISRGARRVQVEFFGGLVTLLSFPAMFIFDGLRPFLILIPVFFFVVTPSVELIIRHLYHKLFSASDERIASKFNTTPEDVKLHTYIHLNDK